MHAVLDAAGSERACDPRALRGRRDGDAVRRLGARARRRARPLRDDGAHDAGRPGYEFAWPHGGARRRRWTRSGTTGARASRCSSASRPATPTTGALTEWLGRLQRLAMDPHYAREGRRAERRRRRPPRPAEHPGADAGPAPPRRLGLRRRATRSTSPSTSRAPGSCCSRASTRCRSSATARRSSARSRSSSPARAPELEPDRVLATVLFTDICKSTERAAELGDARWRSAARAARQPSSARSSPATAAGRSRASATASWPPSTARRARSAPPAASPPRSTELGLRDPRRPAHGRVRGDRRRRRRHGRPHRRARDGQRRPAARCSSPTRSRTSWSAPGCASRTAASTSCAASRARGACGRSA